MWYRAAGVFGTSSIGYAISADGTVWHKYPHNPVLTPAAAKLDSIGSPTVLQDMNGLRMWVHGTQNHRVGQAIFAFVNRGTPLLDR
jgi:hypothetical protein